MTVCTWMTAPAADDLTRRKQRLKYGQIGGRICQFVKGYLFWTRMDTSREILSFREDEALAASCRIHVGLPHPGPPISLALVHTR